MITRELGYLCNGETSDRTKFPIFLPLLLTLFLAYRVIECKSANVGQGIASTTHITSRYQMKNA